MMNVKFNAKDINSMDATTIYWFTLNGTDYGTERDFKSDIFGIADHNGVFSVLDIDGFPVQNGYVRNIVLRECIITDEIRKK